MSNDNLKVKYTKRQQEIIEATLELITDQGLQGASIGRIAAKIGISEPALYRHFKNRRDIIVATLDTITTRICNFFTTSMMPYAINRLLEAGILHKNDILLKYDKRFINPLIEFWAANTRENLADPLRQSIERMVEVIVECLEAGVKDGSIREDLNHEQIAYEIIAVGFISDFAYLSGNTKFIANDIDMLILKDILSKIAKKNEI